MKKYFIYLSLSLSTLISAQNKTNSDSLNGFTEPSYSHWENLSPDQAKLKIAAAKRSFIDQKYNLNSFGFKTSSTDSLNTSACTNIGFELGNMNGWTTTTGTNIKSSTMAGCCSLAGGTSTAIAIGFDTSCYMLNSPLGGTKIVKINDAFANSGVTRISYSYPITASNTLLEYAYQFMSQRSNHICDSLPYMDITVYDALNNVIANTYHTGPKTSGTCSTSPTFTGCVYYPNIVSMTGWKRKAVSLMGYVGTTVRIEVTVADCTKGDHYAYGYFDARCSALDPTCANLDFESGNLNGWIGYNGLNAGSTSMLVLGISPGNIESPVLTGGTDPNKGFSLTSPLGGTKVARLNGPLIPDGNNASVNTISRTFSITPSNSLFQYAYMSILENCSSLCNLQSYMNVSIFDQDGNAINTTKAISNGSACTATVTGFTLTLPFYFTNWIVQSVNLSAYTGSLVTVEFTAGDCAQFGHRGYSYFDTKCSSATSINETQSESLVKIWPNPAGDNLNIQLNAQNYLNSELIIYDVLGKVVLDKKELQTQNTISLQSLNQGIYFYKIISKETPVKEGKLIKE